jgi:hypothetical protein
MIRLTIASIAASIVIALAACRTALAPAAGGEQPSPNGSLVGNWTITFRLDSVRAPGSRSGWQLGSLREAQGRLRLTDSSASGNAVRSSIDVDFTPLLGRQMSCFEPTPRSTGVERQGDTVTFRFTPGVADCGFGASGVLRGDSLIGNWDETSFIGPVAAGRFVMTRSSR